jgi:hypothetical protein
MARLAVGGLAALAIFAALPHWLERDSPQIALHGTSTSAGLAYDGARLGDAIDDLNSYSSAQFVAFPELRERSFTGRLPGPPDAEASARALARQAHLQLVRAGPHWAFVAPPA